MNNRTLNIVLFQPEMPANTGNIIRTCESFEFKLHLIRPYGFIFEKKEVIRYCTNHFNENNIFQYNDFEDFLTKNQVQDNIFFFTKRGTQTPDQINFRELHNQQDIYLMFGKESSGIPLSLLKQFNKEQWCRIPMKEGIISINLSNAVAIASYEVIKQLDYLDLLKDYKE